MFSKCIEILSFVDNTYITYYLTNYTEPVVFLVHRYYGVTFLFLAIVFVKVF